jgi:non-canonical purine NTP pyrophosphatase (RdgB/HAM1 family)
MRDLNGRTAHRPEPDRGAQPQADPPIPEAYEAQLDSLLPLFPWPAVIIMATALAVLVPFLLRGNPSGHDFEFHVFSWMEVLSQWKQGILYPRWAALAHWGYGEARFLFYPPASWTLGAALGALLPWKLAPGAYTWIALTASGMSMFVLARRWLPGKDAVFAAALYAANPYYIVIVYWRSAFAELLAGALLPLLLWAFLRAREDGSRVAIPLALIVAAVWLTNAPSAVMVNYSVAMLGFVAALLWKSPRVLLYAGIAVVLGAALAAFYLVPAAYEEKWVNIAEVLSPGVRPHDNFLFTTINDPDHNRFNLLVSIVAVGEMIVLAGATWFSRRWRTQQREIWCLLVIWAAAATLLTFPITSLFWQHLPKLRFVQLPWRWLLCLNVAFALHVTMGARRWFSRALVWIAMLVVIALVWHRIQAPWWDTAADIQEMRSAFETGQGYEGTDEYVPAGADPYEVKKDAPKVSVELGTGRIQILKWDPEMKLLGADVLTPTTATLRLFNYPAWKVAINNATIGTQTHEVTGQMMIPLKSGKNLVSVQFIRTWDRTVGGSVSLVAVLLVVTLLVVARRRMRRSGGPRPGRDGGRTKSVLVATSNPGKLRDFAGAASSHGVSLATIPEFSSLPGVIEDGLTFEANARKKAEHYSRYAPGQIVIADDSGLEVDALQGAPGVHSTRYAAVDPRLAKSNTDDEANNARLLRELKNVPPERRSAHFVCVIAAARDGKTLAIGRGQADGRIVESPRGNQGFGYDPLFFFPPIQKTFAEIPVDEKARHSHRGAAFRKFLDWYGAQSARPVEE